MRALAIALAALTLGCTTLTAQDGTRITARGDSQTSELRCETMEFNEDGDRVSGTNCVERVSTGGKGGSKLYEVIGQFAALLFSAVSVAIQASR